MPLAPPQDEPRPSFTDGSRSCAAEALARGHPPGDRRRGAGTASIEPLPVVLERDRAQAETVLPLETYIARRLTRENHPNAAGRCCAPPDAARIGSPSSYGVPPAIIVAIWGIESNFGRFSGVRPTVAALATLAWDPRRSAFFRGELFNALEILNRGDIELAKMRGSWAGAMGQPQFMPSSYLRYAEDFDGDGRRDIWDSPADSLRRSPTT